MKDLLESTREQFEERRRSWLFFWRPYNRLTRPRWARRRDTPFECIYRDYRSLLKDGDVVWGHIVQANNLLFEPGSDDHPAAAVFSTDRFFDDHLQTLEKIAGGLFSFKGRGVRDPELAEFADAITDEETVLFNRPLPRSLTFEQKVYYTTLMVHRKHLPRGYLRANWFPLVVAPKETQAAVVLPARYWDAELVRRWKPPKPRR